MDNLKTIKNCNACERKICTHKIPIFSELSEEETLHLMTLIRRDVYNRGEYLVRQGDWVDSLTILNTGTAKGIRYNEDGKEQILHLYGEGDFFGEKSLLRKKRGNFSIIALEGVHVCSIDKEDFQVLVTKYPHIGLKVMEALALRLERLETSVEALGIGSAEDRVLGALAEFELKFGRTTQEGTIITLPVSREGVANYVGLTRESVSKILSRLQEEGRIEMIGNKKILLNETLQDSE